ncbi:hypothetical protein MMC11_003218 [Xylographa trunciseda]|nr:hypothetical protein [Xylographa trunciseda]
MKRKDCAKSEASKMTATKRSRSSVKSTKPTVKSLKPKPASKVSTPTSGISPPIVISQHAGHRTQMDAEATSATPEAFPCFKSGRVLVYLHDTSEADFQLHRAVLERDSSWFAGEFAKTGIAKEGTKYKCILTRKPGHDVPFLAQMDSSNDIKPALESEQVLLSSLPKGSLGTKTSEMPAEAIPALATLTEPKKKSSDTARFVNLISNDVSQNEPSVKLELQPQAVQTTGAGYAAAGLVKQTIQIDDAKSMKEKQDHQQYIVAHESLMGMYYSRTPKISTSNIECALDQCERIVVLAKHYGSLPIVQPYLGNELAQYHRQLYTAIAKDPPRWLTLSVTLESNSIFREAMIHCAGCYPYSPWTTDVKTLPNDLVTIVKAKADGLARLRTETTLELFMKTLKESKDGPGVSLKTSPEAWIAVQIFYHWLSTQARQLLQANKLHYGHHYLLMREGGDAYLPTDKVRNLLTNVGLSGRLIDGSWDDLKKNLDSLKEYAKEAVEQITVDNLMVSAEAMEIPYLTCVDVRVEDFPWTKELGKKLE